MAKMKSIKKYYFTVEGETELWYLKWLQDRINESKEALYRVSFDCQVQKNPLKRAKSMVVTGKTEIWHLSDYESDEKLHEKQFIETMDNMKAAKNIGKQLDYKFGYSNLTFDLWIIIHKIDCNSSYTHRKNYITAINSAYDEHFKNMKEYKRENNFKRCLGKLELNNVINAVNRANMIKKQNEDKRYILHQYKGYSYYKENPSMTIQEIIQKILMTCGLMH